MAELEKTAVLTIDTGASQTTIKELIAQMKELKNQMANVEEGSQEFYELANAASEVKHQVDEINQTVKYSSSDFGDMVGNASKGMAGLVGSINAVKGTMNLLGVESENVEVAIQKMQSAMAVVQGLQAVDQGIKAFKGLGVAIKAASASLNGFKAALVATGIGAAIVAIGMLIAYWDDLKEAIWGGADAAKEAAEEIAASAAKSVDALRDISAELGNLTDQGVENFKAVAIQDLNDITNAERQMDKNFTESAAYLMDLYRLQQQALKQGNIENAKYWKETLNTALEGHDKVKDALNNYIKAVEEGSKREKKANEEVQRSQEAAAKAREDAAKRRKAEAEKAVKELETFKKKYQELSIDISRYNLSGELLDIEKLKDERDKTIEVIQEAQKRRVTSAQEANEQIAAINAHYDELIAEKNKELNQRLMTEAEEARQASVEKAMMAVLQTYDQLSLEISQKQQELSSQLAGGEISDEQYDEGVDSLEIERIQAEIDMLQKQLEVEQLTADERLAIQQNLVAAKIELDEKSAESAKKAAEKSKRSWKTAMSATSTFAGAITDTLGAVSDMMEEGSAEQKAIQTTSAIIATLVGIMQAIQGGEAMAATMGPLAPLGWAMGAAQAAATLATGIATVAQINSANENTNLGGASASVSNSATSSTLVAPVQYTQAVEGASLEQNIQDSRVYVVESDITDTQDKVRVSENEATF